MNGDITSISQTIAAGLHNLQVLRKLESAGKLWYFSGCDSIAGRGFFPLARGPVNKNACENH